MTGTWQQRLIPALALWNPSSSHLSFLTPNQAAFFMFSVVLLACLLSQGTSFTELDPSQPHTPQLASKETMEMHGVEEDMG